MKISGTVSALNALLSAHASGAHRRDALIVTVPFDRNSTGWGDYADAERLVQSELDAHQPRVLIIALDGDGSMPEMRPIARDLVEGASVHATNVLGRDLTAMAVMIADSDDRSLVAQRVSDHFRRTTNLGNGTVIPAGALVGASISDAVLEDVL